MRRVTIVVVVSAVACSPPPAASDASVVDASPDADCNIIWDCWPGLYCADGVVRHDLGSDMVGECTGTSCPSVDVPCPGGCDVEGAGLGPTPSWGLDPAWLCADTPAAAVGDPCGDTCLPTRAVAQPDGTVAQIYLRCELGTCVAADPPVVDGWLAPCVATFAPGFVGVVGDCLVQDVPASPCTATGHTVGCAGDWDCPQGASCDDDVPGGAGHGVCRPGPRGASLALGC